MLRKKPQSAGIRGADTGLAKGTSSTQLQWTTCTHPNSTSERSLLKKLTAQIQPKECVINGPPGHKSKNHLCVVWHTDFIWFKSEAAARNCAVHFVLTTPPPKLHLWMVCDRILDLDEACPRIHIPRLQVVVDVVGDM